MHIKPLKYSGEVSHVCAPLHISSPSLGQFVSGSGSDVDGLV